MGECRRSDRRGWRKFTGGHFSLPGRRLLHVESLDDVPAQEPESWRKTALRMKVDIHRAWYWWESGPQRSSSGKLWPEEAFLLWDRQVRTKV